MTQGHVDSPMSMYASVRPSARMSRESRQERDRHMSRREWTGHAIDPFVGQRCPDELATLFQ
jgi:hypothetical protein